MSDTCIPQHDWFNATLSVCLCLGLVISYAPQHIRIIKAGTSEGFSPLFLFLGSTCSAAGMLNMVTLQWRIVKCCKVVSFGSCIEMTGGIFQVGLQWALFTFIFVLYMMYYPPHLKYADVGMDAHNSYDNRPPIQAKSLVKSSEWRLSIIFSWLAALHLVFIFLITLHILYTSPSSSAPLPRNAESWATFLGVSSAFLATIQYTPQLIRTYNMKLVGALSIPTMVLQSPGSIIMITSIILRPGTNWTSWITFAVAGVMQGLLLAMCIVWKYRQARLGVNDFGEPILVTEIPGHDLAGLDAPEESLREADISLNRALDTAIESDMTVADGQATEVGEETPLLKNSSKDKETKKTWLEWFKLKT